MEEIKPYVTLSDKEHGSGAPKQTVKWQMHEPNITEYTKMIDSNKGITISYYQ